MTISGAIIIIAIAPESIITLLKQLILADHVGRNDNQLLTVSLAPVDGVTRHFVNEWQWLDLSPVMFETRTAQLKLQIEQQPGLPMVTVDWLTISGNAPLLDPDTNKLEGTVSVRSSSSGTQASEFLISLYGLPGTYTMNASVTGSDGRRYPATFTVTPGGTQGETPDPFSCFAINYMKLQQHDGKIYINDAVFSVPDDASIDLAQDNVAITIDDLTYTIPAGSFVKHVDKMDYAYKSASGITSGIKARLNFF